jgi:Histidine kinase-, DNA gyrase B-, and HSP90-like ATPase
MLSAMEATVTAEGAEQLTERKLIMRYAGGLVRHLGLQMYAGAVPAIAELVANAWDADAENVWIEIPLDQPFDGTSQIRVRDDGMGMTFDEANRLYLVVGRDRRVTGSTYTPGGRPIMGRKGLGKLAGFGAAHVVEVWTVKEGWLTAFRMDYEQIVKGSDTPLVAEPYEPELIHDRPVQVDDLLQKGTIVVLKRIQLRKAVNSSQFRISMSRRFAILSDTFRVHLNGEPLTKQEMDFQFRFPEGGLGADDVKGAGTIRWWIGFTKDPIPDDDARGVSVMARGKLVQQPFFFDLSGGAYGQHGMQYMTGEVQADFLDDQVDLVATDRASVLWEDPRARPLLEWGEQKVRELLRKWAALRQRESERHLRDATPYLTRLERFPEREQRELRATIGKLVSIPTIEDERLDEIVDLLLKAYENKTFMDLIRAISAADEHAQAELLRLFEEWDVLEAISVAQTVRGRIEVIRKFRAMIKARVPEKPDMQDFVRDRPWLMNPQWDVLQHERSLDKVLAEHFDVEGDPDYDGHDGSKRLDYFCVADTSLAVIAELKRPGDLVGLDELRQLTGYVDYLRTRERESTDPDHTHRDIKGCLVYGRLRPDAEEEKRRLRTDQIFVVTWDKLLEDAERLHREYLEIVKARAPEGDPRIQGLAVPDEDASDEAAVPGDSG